MIQGLLGRKIGMVQIFDKQGRLRGGTVIETGPCVVTQIKNEQRDGYVAVQIGYGTAKRLNKPERGHVKRLGDFRHLREFRVDEADTLKLGDRIGTELLQEGDRIDITATSKGRGFAGSVKLHHFAGGPKTHGQSDRHRAPGAIGAGNTPGRVFKGMRMASHMGAAQVTVRNVEVLQTNVARGLIIVAGSVPGARQTLVKIRLSKATLNAVRTDKRQVIAAVEEPEVEAAPEADVVEEAAVATDEVAPDSNAEAVDESSAEASTEEVAAPADEEKAAE